MCPGGFPRPAKSPKNHGDDEGEIFMKIVSEAPRAWFPIPNDPDGAAVEFKHLSQGEIEDCASGFEVLYERGDDGELKPTVKGKNATGDARYALVCACVTNWKGVFLDGNAVPCTDKNKIRVCREAVVVDEDGEEIPFMVWAGRCRERLAEDVRAKREAERKNSKK